MTTTENESVTFHNQSTVMRLAMAANVTSWLVLVAYLLGFVSELNSVILNWGNLGLPTELLGQLAAWAGFLVRPLQGVMYFIILQGVAQLLYVGMDLFYEMYDEIEDDEVALAA